MIKKIKKLKDFIEKDIRNKSAHSIIIKPKRKKQVKEIFAEQKSVLRNALNMYN